MLTELGASVISTQSPARAPVDVEVYPPNLPIGVRELWHSLQRHPKPPSRQSPSFHRELKILRGLCGRSPGVGSPKQHIRATGRQQLGAALML